jgi:hypothetical protein
VLGALTRRPHGGTSGSGNVDVAPREVHALGSGPAVRPSRGDGFARRRRTSLEYLVKLANVAPGRSSERVGRSERSGSGDSVVGFGRAGCLPVRSAETFVGESGLGREVAGRVEVSSTERVPRSRGGDVGEARSAVGRAHVEAGDLRVHLGLHTSAGGREHGRHRVQARHLLEDRHEEPDLNLGRVLKEGVEGGRSLGFGKDSEPFGSKRSRQDQSQRRMGLRVKMLMTLHTLLDGTELFGEVLVERGSGHFLLQARKTSKVSSGPASHPMRMHVQA